MGRMKSRKVKCSSCGKRVTIPEGNKAGAIKCQECGARLRVHRAPAAGRGASEQQKLTCRDCGKVFSIPAHLKEGVISCPSCGSWVKTRHRDRSVLYHEVPMPLQSLASILRWLRFLADFSFVFGLAAAVWIGLFYSTELKSVEGVTRRVINPAGMLAAFGALVGAFLATAVLMALYWILQNVTANHHNTRRGDEMPE